MHLPNIGNVTVTTEFDLEDLSAYGQTKTLTLFSSLFVEQKQNIPNLDGMFSEWANSLTFGTIKHLLFQSGIAETQRWQLT